MFYHFELQIAGVILLTAMAAGGISLWLKRRRERAGEGMSRGKEAPGDGDASGDAPGDGHHA